MQGAKPKQDDLASVAVEVKDSDKGHVQITINDNDSKWKRIAKAEQWCMQSLKVTEADYTWSLRLGDTYARLLVHDAASENYKKVWPSVTPAE
jgi:hypothetical protein